MIRLSFNREEEIIITQQDSPPSIYLDNWALRHISEDGSLAQRFINCLKSRNGTLYISQMNLLEFSRVRDQRHVVEIETFLESISPQLFFIDVIPKNVIDRENIIIENNVAKEAPHNDFALARCFITRNHPTLDPLNPKGLFSNLTDDRLQKMCEFFLQKFIDDIHNLREQRNQDPQYKASIQDFPKGKPFQRSTRYIWQDLVNSLIRDDIKFDNTNHLRDLFHAVVPLAYGDLVLLDRTWASKASQTISRLRSAGHQGAVARVFSMSNLDDFWNAFEVFGVAH